MDEDMAVCQGEPRKARSFKESQGRFARDPVAAKECAVLGGEARSRKYAKRRTLREAARTLLTASLSSVTAEDNSVLAAAADMLRAFGVDDPTGADALMLAQFSKACKGDTEAARYIRDTSGERPSDQVQIIAGDRPIDGELVESLTDAQLAELAGGRDFAVAPTALPEAEPVEPQGIEEQ